jgi:hypothetical protein
MCKLAVHDKYIIILVVIVESHSYPVMVALKHMSLTLVLKLILSQRA